MWNQCHPGAEHASDRQVRQPRLLHQCAIAQVEPAIVVGLLGKEALFGFAECDIWIELGFNNRGISTPVLSSINQDAVTVSHPGD